MKAKPIDVELVRALLEYCPEVTGTSLLWKVDIRGANGSVRAKAGAKAGFEDANGYWGVRVKGVRYKAHRLVWALVFKEDPKYSIDHINGRIGDNRVENLRLTPNGQKDNMQNRRVKRAHGNYVGVDWNKRAKKWRARIKANGVCYNLGYFLTEEQAHEAYIKAKAGLHNFQPTPRTADEQ